MRRMKTRSWAVCTDPARLAISNRVSLVPFQFQEFPMRNEIAELKAAVEKSAALLRRRL